MPIWPFKRRTPQPRSNASKASAREPRFPVPSGGPTVAAVRHGDDSGITFAVDAVEPATVAIPTRPMHEVVRQVLEGPIESCCDYTREVVAAPGNPLVGAVHFAFSQHRPLVLSPDAIWLTIAQGLAHHVHNQPERLRKRMVAHEGKLTLTLDRPDFVPGSPENPWPEVFTTFSEAIRGYACDDAYDLIVPSFSTTGPVERAAFEVVLMDVYAPFFDYEMRCICGIPTITLRGTPRDWAAIEARVELLDDYGLGRWTAHLRPICRQLTRASEGEVDSAFWEGIYKPQDQYGPKAITGWINRLFPYLVDLQSGQACVPNPVLKTGAAKRAKRAAGITAEQVPKGIAQVPFGWSGRGGRRAMEFVAGLFGITQHDDLGLEPTIGWAVRQTDDLSQTLLRIRDVAEDVRPGRPRAEVAGLLSGLMRVPKELVALFSAVDGARLATARLGSLDEMRRVTYDGARCREMALTEGYAMGSYRGRTVAWVVIGSLQDGRRLALDLDPGRGKAGRVLAYDPAALSAGPVAEVVAETLADGLGRLVSAEPLESLGLWS